MKVKATVSVPYLVHHIVTVETHVDDRFADDWGVVEEALNNAAAETDFSSGRLVFGAPSESHVWETSDVVKGGAS